MSHSSPTHSSRRSAHLVARIRRAAIRLSLILFACLGLAACASAPDPAKQASTQEARLAEQEHAEALELIGCARAHGIDLPPPTAANKVSTHGVNLKSPRRKAALTACYEKAVSNAAKEQEAPQRLGESTPATP